MLTFDIIWSMPLTSFAPSALSPSLSSPRTFAHPYLHPYPSPYHRFPFPFPFIFLILFFFLFLFCSYLYPWTSVSCPCPCIALPFSWRLSKFSARQSATDSPVQRDIIRWDFETPLLPVLVGLTCQSTEGFLQAHTLREKHPLTVIWVRCVSIFDDTWERMVFCADGELQNYEHSLKIVNDWSFVIHPCHRAWFHITDEHNHT